MTKCIFKSECFAIKCVHVLYVHLIVNRFNMYVHYYTLTV